MVSPIHPTSDSDRHHIKKKSGSGYHYDRDLQVVRPCDETQPVVTPAQRVVIEDLLCTARRCMTKLSLLTTDSSENSNADLEYLNLVEKRIRAMFNLQAPEEEPEDLPEY